MRYSEIGSIHSDRSIKESNFQNRYILGRIKVFRSKNRDKKSLKTREYFPGTKIKTAFATGFK
jgi:hypothetical protein